MFEVLLPVFSSRIFMVLSLIFKSFIHFEFILVYGVRKWSSFIFLHIIVQYSQEHILSRLSLHHYIFIDFYRERRREGERTTNHLPSWGSNPQPKYVPWLGIKPTYIPYTRPFGIWDDVPSNWATWPRLVWRLFKYSGSKICPDFMLTILNVFWFMQIFDS